MKASELVVSLIGPPGSGKGTQARFLVEKFGFVHMGSGDLLRNRQKQEDYTGIKIKEEVNKGVLVPTLVIAHLWFDQMEEIKKMNEFPGIVIDGSPRRVIETELIKGALDWYDWAKNYRIIYLNISEQESQKRLLAENKGRARSDDVEDTLLVRWKYFQDEVKPTLQDLRNRGELFEVNGEQDRPKVFSDILKVLELDDSD
jgi:adenylate kinase